MIFASFLPLLAFVSLVTAHPGEQHDPLSEREIARRELAARDRHLQARTCSNQVAEYTARRKAKRALARRGLQHELAARQASSTASAPLPHYTELQNFTCVTAPEVTEGPYYINNELVRYNLTEDQAGVELVLDIGVLDINTCEPLDNVFVEIWAANATGVYAGYAATLDVSGLPDPSSTPTATESGGPVSSGGPGGPGGGMPSNPLVRNETFLRGGLATDSNGIVELVTVYPGFYEGRTAHIHTIIHSNWTSSLNGTLVSHAGNVLHIGQFFFNESWNDAVFATTPYTLNTNNRTLNTEDSILDEENTDGNNAYLDLELLGESITDGVLGYITVGVDSTASYSISNTNYLNSTGA